MTLFKETELPGIGRKFQFNTRNGDQLVVIIHDDGKRELYIFNPDSPDEWAAAATLDDEEARKLGAIIGGIIYKPAALEEMEVKLDRLVIDWFKVEPTAEGAGKTIGELKIRQRTGATIIAVIEPDHSSHIAPGPDQALPANCTVVLAGTRDKIKACKHLIMNGSL